MASRTPSWRSRASPVHDLLVDLDQHPLGHFERQGRPLQAAVVQSCQHRLGEPGRADLPQREVDREPDLPARLPPVRHLTACLAQHPGAERDDEPGVLGDPEELGRRDVLAAARPADQRLDAGYPRRRQLDYRLVLDAEAAVLDRGAQIGRQLQPPDYVGVHMRGEDLDPAAARILSPGHGQVGVAQQVLGHIRDRRTRPRGWR